MGNNILIILLLTFVLIATLIGLFMYFDLKGEHSTNGNCENEESNS